MLIQFKTVEQLIQYILWFTPLPGDPEEPVARSGL